MHGSRCALLLTALLVPIAAPAQQKKVRIAVLEIRPLATEAAKAELISEIALTEAASMPGFDVIGKSDINSLIGFEKQKQVMGCSDDSACLAEVGGALGVDFIMVGSLGKIGNMYRIDLKLVETRKARVRGRYGASVEGQEEKLVMAIQKAVQNLLGPLTPRGDAVAAVESPRTSGKETKEAPRPTREEASKAGSRLEARPEKARGRGADAQASIAEVPSGGDVGVSRVAGSGPKRKWAYVSGGAGLALVIGGAVAGLTAKSAYDKETAASGAGDLQAYEDNKAKAKSMALVADGLYLGGVVGIGVGSWFWYSSRPQRVALEVLPLPGGAVASISGGF